MDKFEKVKAVGKRFHEKAQTECVCYEDQNGRDWYDVREGWKGAVIAVWPDSALPNCVGAFFTDAMSFVPMEGHTLYEVDPAIVPHKDDVMKLLGYYTFDGKEFSEVKQEAPAPRTKEDILADLIKLQEELKAL